MCNLSPKQAGKMIGSFAGITALFSLIVIIIGTTTLQFQLDAEILQTCGNSGAFRTDCSVKDWEATSWRRLATKAMSDKPTERNLAGSESVHPVTPNLTWFGALFDYKTVGAKMSAKMTEVSENIVKRNFANMNKKIQPTRLLASHVAKNTDDCATANNYVCEDDQKKVYTEYSSDTCALNTDTSDCKGLLEGSNCVVGECCCSKKAKAAWTGSYKAQSSDPEYGYCDSECSTEFPLYCEGYIGCDSDWIDTHWDEPPFVEASCYSRKGDMCEGGANMDQGVKEYLAIFRQYVTYAGIAAIVGVLPALLAAAGKMNNHNSMGNCCGVVSLPSTFLLSTGATGGMAVYLSFVGAYITLACTQTESSFAGYEVSPGCNAECLAAQKHYVGAICNIGSSAGTTGLLMFLVAVLGFVTTIMVCVGFCSNKKQQTAVQGMVVQQVPMQQIMPVQQAVVVK